MIIDMGARVITSHHYKKKTTEQLGDANKIDLYTFIRQTFLLLETLYLIITFFSNEGGEIKIILVHNSITKGGNHIVHFDIILGW